jgi:hypothetical protein
LAKAAHVKLWKKLLIAYLLPTSLLVGAIGWLAYRASHNAMEQQLGQSLISVARTAAWLMSRPRAMALQAGDEATRTYTTLVGKLVALQSASKARRIVLFDRNERALLDSHQEFAIREPIPGLAQNRNELRDVFAGTERSSVLFLGQNDQAYMTAYAPVF